MRLPLRLAARLAPAAIEGLAIFALATGRPWSALALHLGAAGALAEAVYAQRATASALWAGWFWGAVFPVFGPLSGVLLFWPVAPTRGAAPGETWEERRRRAARAALEARQRLQQITPDILPLVDALRDGDANVRIAAIEAMRDSRSKRVVQLLARERNNEVYDVRFRAVEALNRIAKRNLDEIAAARTELANAPDSRAAHRALAQLYYEYADLEVDSAQVNRMYFQRAVEHGNLVLRASPTIEPAVVLLVSDAHQRLGALDTAELGHRLVLKTDPDHVGALTGLAELQFQRRDFIALKGTCARITALGHVADPALDDSLALWSADNTGPTPKWSGQ